MLQLYYDRTCPFCVRVLDFMESKNIPFDRKELSLRSDSPVRADLIQLSGRTQVPFLVDPARDVKMPESADIIRYLDTHYVNPNGPDSNSAQSGSTESKSTGSKSVGFDSVDPGCANTDNAG